MQFKWLQIMFNYYIPKFLQTSAFLIFIFLLLQNRKLSLACRFCCNLFASLVFEISTSLVVPNASSLFLFIPSPSL